MDTGTATNPPPFTPVFFFVQVATLHAVAVPVGVACMVADSRRGCRLYRGRHLYKKNTMQRDINKLYNFGLFSCYSNIYTYHGNKTPPPQSSGEGVACFTEG